MEFQTGSTANASQNTRLGAMMRQVLYALLPGILLMLWFFGWGMISNLLLTSLFALGFEALMLKLRQRPLKPFLSDYSAIVTAWLLALAMPPFAPWWLLMVAIFFSIVVAKHLYGGLGYNPFNPAMIGYAVALVSFPVEMVQWPAPLANSFGHIDFSSAMQVIFSGWESVPAWDGMTSATTLDTIKTGLRMEHSLDSIREDNMFGLIAGKGWEWVSLAWLVGGLWLMYKKIITWHIPVTVLAALVLLSGFFWLLDNQTYASPLYHLLAGGAMLGAFFIATDPVSASTTPVGKVVYAVGIGFLIYLIRVFGTGYPDGVAFAVIIMNMAVPLIDYYTRPEVFGSGTPHE